ncbi:hypothetical protein DPMN_150223 [Dreissena polymorpha]|uniref:Uncharacterized protein n=1 Tax=Dreissena polymorpha TaxID=45954 RepID=A0A9D4J5G0_DREPO|nr:hypothetical protein DPMN_150223 [Dreissena polymorpha]
MPCFEVNTKLGIAMIDVLGGAVNFNNFLSAPDIKEVHQENLMENRAREFVEAVAKESAKDRSGEDGLLDIFTMKNSDGQPRVTSMKKVLDKILPKGATFFITWKCVKVTQLFNFLGLVKTSAIKHIVFYAYKFIFFP